MKHTKLMKAMLFALPLTLAVPAFASPPEDEEADPEAVGEEPSEEEALEDDILLVIDLPIAADQAREAGVEDAEITEALDAAEAAAVSCGDMTEVLDEEAEHVKANGKRKAFGQWVKLQVAEGVRGKELAEAIKDRKAELEEMSDEEKAELDAKIKEVGEAHRERNKAVRELRKKLREDGKEPVLAGKERHDKVMAHSNERHADAKAKWKVDGKPGKSIDERQDAVDAKQDKIDAKQAAGEGDPEKLEKLEDKLEKREDKLEAKEDKADGKADGKGHKKGGH